MSGRVFVFICSFWVPTQKKHWARVYMAKCDIMVRGRENRKPFTVAPNVATALDCGTWWDQSWFSESKSSNREAASSSCRVCDSGCSVGLSNDITCLTQSRVCALKSQCWLVWHEIPGRKCWRPLIHHSRKCHCTPIWLGLVSPLKTRSFPAPLRSKL